MRKAPLFGGNACKMSSAGLYKHREPEKSTVYNYHGEYERRCEECYEAEYEYFKRKIWDVIYKYLDSGVLEHGMARVYCLECGKDLFVAFYCETWFFWIIYPL